MNTQTARFATRFQAAPTAENLALYATVLLHNEHREAFVAQAPLAANDGAGYTNESFWTGVRGAEVSA